MEERTPISHPDPERRESRLYQLMRCTLQLDLHRQPGSQLCALVRDIFAFEAVAIYDADLHEVYEVGQWGTDPANLAQNVFHFETSDDDPRTGIGRRVIRLGAVPIGSLVLRGESTPLTNNAIAALIAITFDRYRAAANETRIEAEREAEQLRASVLDGLAHAYKTPLTAIRAASSGLCEMGRLSPAQAELVSLIDEQATLLNELTTRLLTTAKLGAEGDGTPLMTVNAMPVEVARLVNDAIAGLGERSSASSISVELPDEDLALHCDKRLITMLLTQYLDNACKYSDAGSEITVRAERMGNEVLFSVRSFGAVIPLADRERIFDRYFRSSNSTTRAAGTGIGLSVAKRAALAHGGSVWASSDELEGTTFFAAIPASPKNASAAGQDMESALQRSTA